MTTSELITNALELCGTQYELEAGLKHRLLSELAHALSRAESERDAQHDLVLRLTAERDALVFNGAELEHAMLLAADERDERAADLDEARAQVWGLICVATNGQWRERDQAERAQRNLAFMGSCLVEERRDRDEALAKVATLRFLHNGGH